MMKIAINADYGGFGLTDEAISLYKKIKGLPEEDQFFWFEIARDDPALIQVIEELGDKASGRRSCVKIIEIPDDVEWLIEEYDGLEWVAEKHRVWRA